MANTHRSKSAIKAQDEEAKTKRYTVSELESLPTLCTGQADSLKIDTGTVRVWLSRCDETDGEPYANKVTIEVLVRGSWVELETYQAINDTEEEIAGNKYGSGADI